MKKRLCEFVSALIIAGSSVVFSSCSTPTKVDFEMHKQKHPDCAILVSAPRDWYEYLRTPFEFIYEKAVVSALKEKIDIKCYTLTFSAQWRDLEQVLRDPNIQTIVVSGHGEWYAWGASDGNITERMIAKFMKDNNIKKKQGLFIRHMCGTGRYEFNRPLINDKESVYLIQILEYYGAKNVVLDIMMNDADKDFGRKRNRINYALSSTANKTCIENIIASFNYLFDAEIKSREKSPLGSSVVDHPSKTRGYNGIVGPLDYIFNPIPDEKTPANSNSLGL